MTTEFRWLVSPSGYWVVENTELDEVSESGVESRSEVEIDDLTDRLWVRPVVSLNRPRKKSPHYCPLRNPAIFRMFADLGPDQDSILNFANRFGLLTDALNGESLLFWREQISDMRTMVDLWEKASSLCTDLQKASHVVKSLEGYEMMAGDTVASALHVALDVAVDHFDCLILRVNQRISSVTAVLCRNSADGAEDGVQLQLRPDNLLQAMWLQFGQALADDKSFRKCQCGTWFEISPKVARSDKIFCTESCKARAYRQRVAEEGPARASRERGAQGTHERRSNQGRRRA